MANLIEVKSNKQTIVMNEVSVHPEEAIEKMIFETQNILPEVYLLKRQLNTYNNKERIDVVGLDNENNIVVIEIKDEMVDESIFTQVINYAVWVETHPDAIKNLWYENNQTPEDFDWKSEPSIRIIVVAPSFKDKVQALRIKFGYPIDLIEFKKFLNGNESYIFLNTLPPPEALSKAKPIDSISTGAYTEEIYKANFNPTSAQVFWQLAYKLEEYVKFKKWNLNRVNNKNYIAFKYGFPTVFGLQFVGSKSFCFFFKVPKSVAEAVEIKGQELYRYEDQWKQALYKVEDENINLSLFDPLFEAAYKNIVDK